MFELTDVPRFDPGCCAKCQGSTGPFVDLQVDIYAQHLYLCGDCAIGAAECVGALGPQAAAALGEIIESHEAQIAELQRALDDAHAVLADAEDLRRAIAFTLERGVVLDSKTGKLGIRGVPGQRKPNVGRVLVESGDGRVADDQPADDLG